MTRPEQRRTRAQDAALSLGDFIRDRQQDILTEWLAEVRLLPIASALDRPALIDHVPDVLDRIAAMADCISRGETPEPPKQAADLHARVRLEEGFDLPQVVSEFTILRDCITRLWEQSVVNPSHIDELRVVNKAIDNAVGASVDRFTRARDRTLIALDRIASEALESRSLDDLLQRLLKVFVEFTASVDTAAIVIREGDLLRVRAALGLNRESEVGLTMKVGEGFAGTVAKERRAIGFAAGAAVPWIRSEILRSAGIRALYGVPLIDGNGLMGVAHMGSLTANEFSMQDKRLLSAMANRATSAIFQHLLREAAEKSSAELSAILESIPAAVFIGTDQALTRANRAALDLLGYDDADQLVRQPVVSLVEALDMRDAASGARLDVGNGPVRTAVRGVTYQRDVVIHDHTAAKDAIVHAVAAPIVRDGNVIGAVAVTVDVTAHKRIEEALRERELEFRTLAEHIPQLVWIADRTGSAYWFNQRWFDYTGTKLGDVEGWGWQRVQHPEHVERVTETIRRAIAGEEPWEATFPIRGQDGIYRWFLSQAVPVRDDSGLVIRWFSTATDVTEQRFLSNATKLLASSLDMMVTLDQLANLAVPELADWCVVDLLDDGQIERVAIAHSDRTKVAVVREWSQRYPSDLQASGGIGEVIRTGQAVLYPAFSDAQFVRIARDAEHLRLMRELGVSSVIIAPLVAHGETFGAITLIRAESHHRYGPSKLETVIELGRRAGYAIENARLYRNAQDATRAREEILAIVSHDLRNPLAAIDLGATVALETSDIGPKARKHVEAIHRAAGRMAHLLGDLLDAASLRAGRLPMAMKNEDVAAVVARVIEAHEELARKHGIELVCDCPVQGARIYGDRDRLMQAFGNLIGNALKFCGRGDVVTVRARVADRQVAFEVADGGPGIADDELPRIFEPYWSAKRHAKQGIGLGLYICKAIIEAHNGTISVDSKPGRGTTFSIAIPLLDPGSAP
jgi:PAS domain S-box-containing protein